MSIKKINAGDLRQMKDGGGLVLQGCGGDLQEWLDGINGLFTEEKLLLDGTKFKNIYAFENEGLTNILFPFNDSAKLDMGRLAIWRLRLHEQFGGTWFFDYDYISNRLDDFTEDDAENIDEGMI